MQFYLAALALAVAGAGAQSTTVTCESNCPSAIPDKTITRSKEMPTETAPCPSLIVSSIAGSKNITNPMVPQQPGGGASGTGPNSPAFTGGAAHVGGSMGAAIAIGAAFLAL